MPDASFTVTGRDWAELERKADVRCSQLFGDRPYAFTVSSASPQVYAGDGTVHSWEASVSADIVYPGGSVG